jgi:SAM-dependent methyltransferase/uncharacterized protein YbaR (Trm112 family)
VSDFREVNDWLHELLRCPVCARSLAYDALTAEQGLLKHETGDCIEQFPVIDGIPRMLLGDARAQLLLTHSAWFADHAVSELTERWRAEASDNAVIAAFDDEWKRFPAVGTEDQAEVFALYFDLVPRRLFGADQTVLDAGCGAGRWAFEVAKRGPRVIAIDLGNSIEVARANTPTDRVACLQADLGTQPLAPGAVDWAYSLGVLHHTTEPGRGLGNIVEAVKPGGLVLLYLYYALDNRGALTKGVFRAVDFTRRVVSRQPRPVVRTFAAMVATLVYWPLARAAALVERAGASTMASRLPLSFYRHRSFLTMRNDSLDRFGTRLEKRYTREQMNELMRAAGLIDVSLANSAPFWHGIASKPLGHG